MVRKLSILLVLGFILISGFILSKDQRTMAFRPWESSGERSNAGSPFNVSLERSHWEKRLGEEPVLAYQEFKKKYAQSDFSTQHLAAHLFGQSLYQKVGIDGLAICDDSFSYGCYHSFFGSALAANGLKVLSRLDRVCAASGEGAVACQHGIGHGLLEYMGGHSLAQALEACAALTPLDPYFSCQSGVFMEYNTPIDIDETSAVVTPRKLDPSNLFDPCDAIDDAFKESCIYNLPQLWDKALDKNYSQIGALCTRVANEKARAACFSGIGSVAAPSSDYNVGETAEKCRQIPDEQGQEQCLIRASWAIFASTGNRLDALALCKNLSAEMKGGCVPPQ